MALATGAARSALAAHGWRHGWDVDMDGLLDSLAWKVLFVPLPDGEQEWTVKTPAGDICVFLRDHLQLDPKRRRWNQAHAAGHIVLGHPQAYNAIELTKADEHVLCREADTFARELLLPAKAVRAAVAECFPGWRDGLMPGDVGHLADRFEVSWSTMMYRLDETRVQDKHLSLALHHFRFDPLHHDHPAPAPAVEARAWRILEQREPRAVEARDQRLRFEARYQRAYDRLEPDVQARVREMAENWRAEPPF